MNNQLLAVPRCLPRKREGGRGWRAHLLLAFVMGLLTTQPFRDGEPWPLQTQENFQNFGAQYCTTLLCLTECFFHGSGRVRVTRPDPPGLKTSWPDPTRPVIFHTPPDPTPLDPRYFDSLMTCSPGLVKTREQP